MGPLRGVFLRGGSLRCFEGALGVFGGVLGGVRWRQGHFESLIVDQSLNGTPLLGDHHHCSFCFIFETIH